MADNHTLSEVATFIQEGRALRSICKGTRPEELVFSNIFTWISHVLFNDIELKPSALRHAIQTHIFRNRKDIIKVLLSVIKNSGNNANILKKLTEQVIDPKYDSENSFLYLYCLATFLRIDIYVVTRESEECRWNEFKALNLLGIKQEIVYKNNTYTFKLNKDGHPGFLMAYMHTEPYMQMNMYVIPHDGLKKPERPRCIGLLETAARELKKTPLDQIDIPKSLTDDVRKNANLLPMDGNLKDLVKEYCRGLDFYINSKFFQNDITSYERPRARRLSYQGEHRNFVRHLKAARRKNIILFCAVLVKRLEVLPLKCMCSNFDSLDIPFIKKYNVLNNLEKELGRLSKALSFGSLPTELKERRGTVNTAVIATSAIGLVGTVLGAVGLALAPVTFGVSTGLSIAGGVISVGSGGVQGLFRFIEAVKQNGSATDITKLIEEMENDFDQALESFNKEFDKDDFKNRCPERPGWSIRGSMTIGSVFRAVHGGVEIGLTVAKVGATAVKTVKSVLGPLGAILDIGFMAEAIHDKVENDDTTELGMKLECLRTYQTHVLVTFRGNADFNVNIPESTMKKK